MDKKISIVNTRENEFEFDISIEGVKTEEMVVSFVIETKEVNLQFPCKKEGEKWAVIIPPTQMLELASYPFCVTIVVDGYFFKPFEGTAMVIHEPTVKKGAAKKMAPPVVKMRTKEVEEEVNEESEEETTPPAKKKVKPKKKTTTRRKKKVVPKAAAKEEKVVEEPVTPPVEEPVVEKEPIVEEPVVEKEPAKEKPVVEKEPVVEEEPVIVEEPKSGFEDMAAALLKKHRIPRAGLAPSSKQDKAALEIIDALEEEKKLAESVKNEKKAGKKDKAVQDILLGTLTKS